MGDVVAGIANALYLGDLAKHRPYLALGVVAEVGVAHRVEIFGNLDLHVVGDVLVFLYALVELVLLAALLLSEQVGHHAEHAFHALGKALYFLLCLEHREFRGLHDAHLDEAQAELVLVALGLATDNGAHHLLHLRDEPDEHEGVGDIEARMERREHDGQDGGALCHGVAGALGVVAHQPAHHADEGIEQQHDPDDAEDIEQQVGEGRPPGLRVGSQGSQVGRGRGADILAHHQRDAQVDGQHTRGAEHDGDGHHGRRALHDASDEGADEQEDEDGEMALGVERQEETDGIGVVAQVEGLACVAQQHQREEQEGNAK